jgi:sulfide:quinone oxidoreductase
MTANSPGNRATPLRVLIAGGGVAALEAALALRALAEERVALELLAPEPHFWYRPLAVVEPFGQGRLHGIEHVALAREIGAQFTLGRLESVESDRHVARTAVGAEIDYDVLVVASGARPVEAVEGATLTFRGAADSDAFGRLMAELESGAVRRLVFAVPGGVAWPLPLYELALMTAAFLAERGADAELALVTPEAEALGVFGHGASEAVARLLADRGVEFHAAAYPVRFEHGRLEITPGTSIAADRVVALPRLAGAPIAGLPCDADGFVPTDAQGRVEGVEDVFAAGDVTTFPVKQGGLATQQALAAAQAIAAQAGAPVVPQPFRPVLRGLLLTGAAPAYLRTELRGGVGDPSVVGRHALWWPPGKIVGTYLAPFLAEWADAVLRPPEGVEAIEIAVELSVR